MWILLFPLNQKIILLHNYIYINIIDTSLFQVAVLCWQVQRLIVFSLAGIYGGLILSKLTINKEMRKSSKVEINNYNTFNLLFYNIFVHFQFYFLIYPFCLFFFILYYFFLFHFLINFYFHVYLCTSYFQFHFLIYLKFYGGGLGSFGRIGLPQIKYLMKLLVEDRATLGLDVVFVNVSFVCCQPHPFTSHVHNVMT